jgi:hypothetical protein
MPSLSKPALAGLAVALLVGLAVLGFKMTLLLLLLAAVAYAVLRRRAGGTTPAPTTAPATSSAPSPTPATTTPGTATASGTATSADEVIADILHDCVEQGFFKNHAVKTESRRHQPRRVTMTAATKSAKNVDVVVTAVESEYGVHVDTECRERQQGLAAGLALNALGSAAKTGYDAGRSSAMKKQEPALKLEMAAFERQVLSRHLA